MPQWTFRQLAMAHSFGAMTMSVQHPPEVKSYVNTKKRRYSRIYQTSLSGTISYPPPPPPSLELDCSIKRTLEIRTVVPSPFSEVLPFSRDLTLERYLQSQHGKLEVVFSFSSTDRPLHESLSRLKLYLMIGWIDDCDRMVVNQCINSYANHCMHPLLSFISSH